MLCGGKPTRVAGRGRSSSHGRGLRDARDGADARRELRPGGRRSPKSPDDEAALGADERQPLRTHRRGLDLDPERARRLGAQLEVGTVFMNRCDYLDPMLPWVGVKDSGRGLSLSRWGIQEMTRAKSYHFRIKT